MVSDGPNLAPKRCAGCGLSKAVDPEHPAPHETTFGIVKEQSDEDSIAFECQTCSTMTRLPVDGYDEEKVECENCGELIPESLQGYHMCTLFENE